MTEIKSKKGNDRTISLVVKDGDSNPIDITNYTITFRLYYLTSGTTVFSKDFTITDGPSGLAQVALTDDQLNIDTGRYGYSVHTIDGSSIDLTYLGGDFIILDRYDEEAVATTTSYDVVVSSTTLNVTITSAAGIQAQTFKTLTDTPSSYSGEALKFVRVNSGEDELEFVNSSVTVSELNDIQDVTITSVQTNDTIKWNGSAWINTPIPDTGISDVVDDTTPQLGGNLDGNGKDINIDTNNKITFDDNKDTYIIYEGGKLVFYVDGVKKFDLG